ncbi:hypothetical protein SGFS_015400 [Streptomyces graminofaciens]|uniref:Uncharacterized protein n=1 Tax=Streptomyces graminofaciens TaxID=68212 RepID=A0ABM7F0Q9_9ACTN|nr:hypothetical protein SGFS_015400 [Streptomyces graminofaciens]
MASGFGEISGPVEDQLKEPGSGPAEPIREASAVAGPGDSTVGPTASNARTSPLMNVRIRGVAIDSPLSEAKRPASIVAWTWPPWKRSHASKEFARATRRERPAQPAGAGGETGRGAHLGRPNVFCAKP